MYIEINNRYNHKVIFSGVGNSIFICGSRHNFWAYDRKIEIGCECHAIAEWIENYAEIGKKNYYTESEIAEYKQYIDFAASALAQIKK